MSNKPQKYVRNEPAPFNPNELLDAQKNPEVGQLYFNAFTLGITGADIVCLLKQNNNPKLVCNMSFTVAKTFVRQLNAMLVQFEANAENQIMTMDVIDKALTKMKDGDK